MEILVRRNDLVKELQLVQGIVERKNSIPILSNILAEARGGELRISATDLESWQELVYDGCTGCGRCDMMCPMGIKISALINVTREGLAAAGFMPIELRALQEEQQEHQHCNLGCCKLLCDGNSEKANWNQT